MKIVFSGGGTAGHVMPNLALIDKLQAHTVYYIGTDGMEKGLVAPLVADKRVTYLQISASKLQRKATLGNLLLPFRLIKSVREAKRHLRKIQPDVIFSKGGYVGLPTVIAGRLLHIPTVIHESDMSAGLANRISAKFADVYLSAFPCDKRAKTVGVIVREVWKGDKDAGLATMGFDGSKPILLVTGGSLGAKVLNDAVTNCPNLAKTFDIFVITGKGKRIHCPFVHQAEFANNMCDLFKACDVCLTRAGANILAELTLAQVPFVAVPLTKQSRGEQVANARYFAQRGCGITLDEKDLSQTLERAVTGAYRNRNAFCAKQKACKELYGTDKTAKIILDVGAHQQKKLQTTVKQRT